MTLKGDLLAIYGINSDTDHGKDEQFLDPEINLPHEVTSPRSHMDTSLECARQTRMTFRLKKVQFYDKTINFHNCYKYMVPIKEII